MAEGFFEGAREGARGSVTARDSQSAIDLANNPVYHDRIKHIDVRYHFIRKMLKDDVFLLLKIHMSQNLADMLTKVIALEKLKSCSTSVGLQG